MSRPHIRVVAAEIEVDGRYLITQRRSSAVLPDLWEFPGGRVEDGESDAAALARELHEKLGCTAQVDEPLMVVEHAYDVYDLTFVVLRARLLSPAQAQRVQQIRWVRPDELDQYPFPGADQRTVDALLGVVRSGD